MTKQCNVGFETLCICYKYLQLQYPEFLSFIKNHTFSTPLPHNHIYTLLVHKDIYFFKFPKPNKCFDLRAKSSTGTRWRPWQNTKPSTNSKTEAKKKKKRNIQHAIHNVGGSFTCGICGESQRKLSLFINFIVGSDPCCFRVV